MVFPEARRAGLERLWRATMADNKLRVAVPNCSFVACAGLDCVQVNPFTGVFERPADLLHGVCNAIYRDCRGRGAIGRQDP